MNKILALSLTFFLTSNPVFSQATLPEEISFWVNAYIPGDTDNKYIWDHASGSTVVSDPLGIACYTTDERGPSDDSEASSRINSFIRVELVEGPPWIDIVESGSFVGETTGYGCATTEVECVDTADMDEEEIQATRLGNLLTVQFDLAAGNPCSLLASNIGAIDIEVTVTLNLLNGEFTYEGKIDDFPNYEMYVQYDDDDPVNLFSFEIDDDSSPQSLVGDADKDIEGEGAMF